jgi:hypothetical protein
MKNQLTLAMFLAYCLAVFLGSSVKVAAAPTIPNPSFEVPGHTDSNPFIILPSGSTYITGWTVGGAGVDYFRADGNPLFAADGLYSVNYVRGPGGGSLSTIISGLVAGTEYDLSFDVIQRDLGAGTALTVMVDSTSQTYINTASDVWQRQHLLFIAGGSTASLTFAGPATGALDSAFAHVDNVAIASIFPFEGFFPPVDNLPTLNRVNAGRAIPVKFSLGGDEGLSIFAPGYPKSQAISWASSVPVDDIEETVTPGASALSYDATTDRYTYVWKTDKAWAGTCRQLIVKLKDNSEHRANFDFR